MIKRRKSPFMLVLVAAGLVSGCANYAGIHPEARTLDAEHLPGLQTDHGDLTWPDANWWQVFGDEKLSSLIEAALQDHPSLQAAQARLARAQAALGVAESAQGPQVDLSASSTNQRYSENGMIPPPYAGSTRSANDLSLGAGWTLDFFGRNRHAFQAALGEYRANEVEAQAARIQLSGDIARTYFRLAQLLQQERIGRDRLQQRTDLTQLVERRFRAGIENRMEWSAQQGALAESQRDLAALDEQIRLTRHALAALLGQGPEAANDLDPALPALTVLPLPNTIPAGLLGRRPDVVAARWRVGAALSALDASKAQFYPNINLRAFTGFSALGLENLLEGGSRQAGAGLAISLPIFDSGRLRSQYRQSAAQVDGAVATYNGALLTALREVADQLTTLQALETQNAHQQTALENAERTSRLADQRYRAGISDRLTALNAETNYLAQQRQSVDLQARWVDSRIRLIQALGGGFQSTNQPLANRP